MADAAAARREARRRRILENSQDRLQRIAGKNSSSDSLGAAPVLLETPTTDYSLGDDVPTVFASPLPLNGSVSHTQLFESIAPNVPELENFIQNLTSGAPTAQEPAPRTAWEKLSLRKIDIILIAVLVQMTYSALWTSAALPSIFLPLIIYEVTKMLMCKTRKDAGIVSAMLLMNGVSPERVQSIMLITQSLFTFLQDVCVYLFFTVFMQSFYMFFFNQHSVEATLPH